jgi:hypothetical protein
MNELTLKIESTDPNDLVELQEYILAELPEVFINETYKHQPGFNKEPILVSIIIALGGKKILDSVRVLISSYWKHKLETLKENNHHREEMFKLSIKSNTKNYKSITTKDLFEMNIDND